MKEFTRLRVRASAGAIAVATLLAGMATAVFAQPRPPEKIYATNCAYCHGHNVGPIIRGRKLPPELIDYMVRNGNGAMPAFRPTEITPTELAALAKWVSRSAGAPKEHGR